MENVLVNGLVAVAENFRNLLVNVTGRFGDVLGGLQTASQNSTQVLTHSRQDFGMRKGSMHAIDVHTPLINLVLVPAVTYSPTPSQVQYHQRR